MKLVSILALVGLRVLAVSLPPMPVSPYADTEVSTNVAFNSVRSDVKEFELKFSFEGCTSNSIQVALGRDSDKDGALSFAETGAVYGWRNGRYFAEDVVSGKRFEDPMAVDAAGTGRVFSVKMRTSRNREAKEFDARAGSESVLTNLSQTCPVWLYRPEWNMMRITRRGIGEPAEWFTCDIGYSSFYITIR
jgi:hypothetical protein